MAKNTKPGKKIYGYLDKMATKIGKVNVKMR